MKTISNALGEAFVAISKEPTLLERIGGPLGKGMAIAGFSTMMALASAGVEAGGWTDPSDTPAPSSGSLCQTSAGKTVARVLSGVVGGGLGSLIGGGNGKTIATIAGSVIGSEAGNYACSDSPAPVAKTSAGSAPAANPSVIVSNGQASQIKSMGANFFGQLDGSVKPTQPLTAQSQLQMSAAAEKLSLRNKAMSSARSAYQQTMYEYEQRTSPEAMMVHEVSAYEMNQMRQKQSDASRAFSQASQEAVTQAVLVLKGFDRIAATGQDVRGFAHVANMVYDAAYASQSTMDSDGQRYAVAQQQRSGGSVSNSRIFNPNFRYSDQNLSINSGGVQIRTNNGSSISF